METAETDEEKVWCSEMFEENVHYAKQAQQQRPTQSTNQNNQARHHHHHHHTKHHTASSPYMTLNCFTFVLDQKEFQQLYIKSADLYMKLDLTLLNKMLFYVAESLGKSDETAETAANMRSSLLIELNGEMVKQFEMSKLDEYLSNQAAVVGSAGVTAEDSLFDYADIKHIIEDEIYRVEETASPVLRVRIKFRNEAIAEALADEENTNFGALNMTSLNEKLADLFTEIEDSVALHVKFGDKIVSRSGEGGQSRNKRQQKHHNRKMSNGNRNQGKHYRDCADQRKAGYTTTNFTCCRETITFTMEQIGWSHWILSPKVIEYKYCRGGCLCKFPYFKILLLALGRTQSSRFLFF
jgi:hypothetical protein